MKCPFCQNEEFIKSELPYLASEGPITPYDKTKLVTCLRCGYTALFNQNPIERYKNNKKLLIEKQQLLADKQIKISNLEKSCNLEKHKKIVSGLKKQLKELRSLGVEDKTTRALQESIQEEEKIISSGRDPQLDNRINNLKYEIKVLTDEIERLEELLRLVS